MSESRRIRIRDRIIYVAARLVIGVTASVPEWLGYRVAAMLGHIWFRMDGRRQRYALSFLREAYPNLGEREHLRLGRAATASLFKVPLDMARLTRLLARGGDLRDVVDCSALDREIDNVPRPFFALSGHLGGWEVCAAAVAALAGPAHGIARITKNPLLNGWLARTRAAVGLNIYPRRGGFRDLARAMDGGDVGLQVVDQNQRLRGVFAPFFGKVASCERAAASLAIRRGYPLVFTAAVRKGAGFRFELIVEPTFTPERTGDKAADLHRAVVAINDRLERMIRRAPEQYVWIHDRYRTQPADEEADVVDAASVERA